MPKMVKITLKELDEIISITTPVVMLLQDAAEFVLSHNNSMTHGLFCGELVQFCGKEIEVVDKADYEYADSYCLYHKDCKYRITDWMVKGN